MSSRPSESSQHVGRIVDPDVRDDGELEAVIEYGVPAPSDVSVIADEKASSEGDQLPVVEPVPPPFTVKPVEPTLEVPSVEPAFTPLPPGVKLMTPAPLEPPRVVTEEMNPSVLSATKRVDAPLDFEGLGDEEPSARRSRDGELDLVGGGLLGRPNGMLPRQSTLSPNLVAFFGAVTGLLTVATIIAIAMRLDRVEPLTLTAPSATASARLVPEAQPPGPTVVVPKVAKRQRIKIPGPYRVKDSASDPLLRVVEGQVGRDPLLKTLEKMGLPLNEAYRVLKAFEKVRPLNKCSKSDRFAFALDRGSRRVKAFEFMPGSEDVFQAREGKDGLLSVERLDLKIQRERVDGAFAVAATGLESSVTDGGFEPALIRAMREAMTGHLSLDELEPGTRVRVIAQEVTALGEFVRYSGVESLEVTFSSERKPLRIYHFDSPKSRGYFDETARSPYEGGWRNPIPGARITSKFNLKRMHPVLHVIKPHTGMDYGAPAGTPIGSCSFGKVTFVGVAGPCGNTVKIEHAGGVETGYCHLSRFAEGLKVGDKVTRLQPIGYVGSTGRSTGPHLHFFVKRNGEFIDPESLHLDALRVLPADERAVFMEHKAQYDAKLDAIALPPTVPAVPAAPPPEDNPSEGDEDEAMGAAMGESAAPAVASAAAPERPSAGTAQPAKASSALYLTDEELMKQQKLSDDGEVAE